MSAAFALPNYKCRNCVTGIFVSPPTPSHTHIHTIYSTVIIIIAVVTSVITIPIVTVTIIVIDNNNNNTYTYLSAHYVPSSVLIISQFHSPNSFNPPNNSMR